MLRVPDDLCQNIVEITWCFLMLVLHNAELSNKHVWASAVAQFKQISYPLNYGNVINLSSVVWKNPSNLLDVAAAKPPIINFKWTFLSLDLPFLVQKISQLRLLRSYSQWSLVFNFGDHLVSLQYGYVHVNKSFINYFWKQSNINLLYRF